MEKFNQSLKDFWVKVKEFFTKKWLGFPVWAWASGLVLILVMVFLFMPKKTYK